MAQKVSVSYLRSLYNNRPVTVDEDIYIEGVVISNDRSGNFYKTLVVEDETGGITVKVDLDDVFDKYWTSQNIELNCNSLVLGGYGNSVQMGVASADGVYETDRIPAQQLNTIITERQDPWRANTPTTLTLGLLSARYIDCFVCFDDVQFVEEERGLAWCDEGEDTNRHIIDRYGNTLVVRSSGRTVFADRLLPGGSGYIEGVLGFFGSEYQLVINGVAGVDMREERFTPVVR